MTIYTVTTSNWNNPAFWSGINETTTGHTLDFTALGAGYTVTYDAESDNVVIDDGATSFTIGDSGFTGTADATLGGTTVWDFFTTLSFPEADDYIVGSDNADTINGGDGDDSIDGGGGNDWIEGSTEDGSISGNSVLLGGSGNDTIFARAGDDVLSGGADADILLGGTGNDTIYGGVGDYVDAGYDPAGSYTDVLYVSDVSSISYSDADSGTVFFSGGGSLTFDNVDVVTTLSNNHTVEGTAGNDVIDRFYVDSDGDWIDNDDALGGGEADVIDAGDGNDSIWAGAGNDTVDGGTGDDDIYGNAGNDTLDGGAGADTIYGGAGDDTVLASGDGDLVYGGAGNDTLNSGSGDDTIYGDAGDDTVVVGSTDGADALYGGDGADKLNLNSSGTSPVSVTFSGDGAGTYAFTPGGNGNFSGFEQVQGTDLDDTLNASADTAGVTLAGSLGDDTITGGSGADALIGGAGNDELVGGSGDDTLSGGDGNDTVTGGAGADTLDGGAFFYDKVDYSGSASEVNINLSDGLAESGGDAEGDVLSNFEQIAGSLHGDTIVLGATGMDVGANGGNDTVTGGAGNDRVWGGDGDDRIRGGAGDDLIEGQTGNDTLIGNSGNDTLLGGSGNDFFGSSNGSLSLGDDYLVGGTGDDTFMASVGNNTMEGGDGSDTFIVLDWNGIDVIDGGEGGSDDDHLDFSDRSQGIDVSYTGAESGTFTAWHTGDSSFTEIERVTLTSAADTVDARSLTEGISVDGNNGDDTLLGGDGSDTFDGGTGNDSLDGGGGADTMTGGDGADTLLGGGGDDTLIGGLGDDSLSGGDGNDLFVYSVGDGADTITDFNTGNSGALNDGDDTNNDFIDLSAFYDDIWELHADQADDGVLNQSNDGVDGVDYSDNTSLAGGSLTFTGASADGSFFTVENTGVVCFTPGIRIATDKGPIPVECIRVGDRVQTADNGFQPVVWVGKRCLTQPELAAAPNLKPIFIEPGPVLGNAVPLLVSPQHRLVLRSDYLGDLRDAGEAFIRAKFLPEVPNSRARVAHGKRQVTYIHLMTERHEVIYANGVATETFWPGPQALRSLDAEARAELLDLFPELTRSIFASDSGCNPSDGPAASLARTDLKRKHLCQLSRC